MSREVKQETPENGDGPTGLDIKKITQIFECHSTLGLQEFLHLYKGTIDPSWSPPTVGISTKLPDQGISTKHLEEEDDEAQKQRDQQDVTLFKQLKDTLKKWSELSEEEKVEINSRMYDIPANEDLEDDSVNQLITDKDWESILRNIRKNYEKRKTELENIMNNVEERKKAPSGKFDQVNREHQEICGFLAGLKTDTEYQEMDFEELKAEYERPTYFDDHYTYDIVAVFDRGDVKKKVTFYSQEKFQDANGIEKARKKKESVDQESYFCDQTAHAIGALKRAGLKVKLYWSSQEDEIYCMIGASESRLRKEATRTRMDIPLNPETLVTLGVEMRFRLAMKIKQVREKEIEENQKEDEDTVNDTTKSIAKGNQHINENHFSGIYGWYKESKKLSTLYQRHDGDDDLKTSRRHPNTVFSTINRLKLTRSIIEAENLLGGANLMLESSMNIKKSPVVKYFPLHDKIQTKKLKRKVLKRFSLFKEPQPVEGMREYFGEQIGMYFNFLYTYTTWLFIPGFLGLLLTIWQLYPPMDFGIAVAPLFGFFMCVWSTGFLEVWKRKTAVLRMVWGMGNFAVQETDRPEFQGDFVASPVTGEFEEVAPSSEQVVKRFVSSITVFSYISVVVISVFGCFQLRSLLTSQYRDWRAKAAPPAINAIVILVFNFVWGKFAEFLNDWENHKTASSYESSLVEKTFVFKFVNSYVSLVYIGFIKRWDRGVGYCKGSYLQTIRLIDRDTTAGEYWFTKFTPLPYDGKQFSTRELFQNAPEIVSDPLWKSWVCESGAVSPDGNYTIPETNVEAICYSYKLALNDAGLNRETDWDYRGDCLFELGLQLIIIFCTLLIVNNTLEIAKPKIANWWEHKTQTEGTDGGKQSTAELESEFGTYEGTFYDFDELVVQFGYVSLFVVAFPVIPLLAFINNWVENWVDGTKLLNYSQRPHPRGAYDIGSWYTILNIISYISIVTNVGLALLNENLLFSFGSVVFDTLQIRILVFLAMEHVLILSKLLLALVIPDSSDECDEHHQRSNKICELYITMH